MLEVEEIDSLAEEPVECFAIIQSSLRGLNQKACGFGEIYSKPEEKKSSLKSLVLLWQRDKINSERWFRIVLQHFEDSMSPPIQEGGGIRWKPFAKFHQKIF
tara:strand:+ start:162 stop:467 length:306 start_codon:yes stop_codon:yes gene_type:complete